MQQTHHLLAPVWIQREPGYYISSQSRCVQTSAQGRGEKEERLPPTLCEHTSYYEQAKIARKSNPKARTNLTTFRAIVEPLY